MVVKSRMESELGLLFITKIPGYIGTESVSLPQVLCGLRDIILDATKTNLACSIPKKAYLSDYGVSKLQSKSFFEKLAIFDYFLSIDLLYNLVYTSVNRENI